MGYLITWNDDGRKMEKVPGLEEMRD